MTGVRTDADDTRERLWRHYWRTENEFYKARMALRAKQKELEAARSDLLDSEVDLLPILSKALDRGTERGAALRLLLMLDEGLRRAVFPKVLDLASYVHPELTAAREVILSIDKGWLRSHLPPAVDQILDRGTDGDEEYRRLAELVRQVDPALLGPIVGRAAHSRDPDIREFAEDFGDALRRDHRDPPQT